MKIKTALTVLAGYTVVAIAVLSIVNIDFVQHQTTINQTPASLSQTPSLSISEFSSLIVIVTLFIVVSASVSLVINVRKKLCRHNR